MYARVTHREAAVPLYEHIFSRVIYNFVNVCPATMEIDKSSKKCWHLSGLCRFGRFFFRSNCRTFVRPKSAALASFLQEDRAVAQDDRLFQKQKCSKDVLIIFKWEYSARTL